MTTHLKVTQVDNDRPPTPAEQIVIDLMGAVVACILAKQPDGAFVPLVDIIRGSFLGFSDDRLIDLLREKGYHVETTDSSFTVSQSH